MGNLGQNEYTGDFKRAVDFGYALALGIADKPDLMYLTFPAYGVWLPGCSTGSNDAPNYDDRRTVANGVNVFFTSKVASNTMVKMPTIHTLKDYLQMSFALVMGPSFTA